MNLDLNRNKIFREFEALRLRWEKTAAVWQDVVQQEFAEVYWKRLEEAVVSALAAMDRLAPILVQVREQCSDRESS